MACKSCNRSKMGTGNVSSKKDVIRVEAVDFTVLSTKHSRIRSLNKDFPINIPLIKMRPPTGYGIHVIVKGHNHYVDGNVARQVVEDVIELYKTNGVDITPMNAWYNANIYWLKQLSIRHGYTTVDNLLALADK